MNMNAATIKKTISFATGIVISFSVLSMVFAISGCASKSSQKVFKSTVVNEELNGNLTTKETVESFSKGNRNRHKQIIVDERAVYEKMRCVDKKGNVIKAKNNEQCRRLGGKVIVESLVEEHEVIK